MRTADPHVRRVVIGYSEAARQVRTRVEAFVRGTWGGLGNYRDKDIDRFVRRVVPVVTGGQRRLSALTDAYLATIATATLGQRTRPVGIPADVISHETIRGVSAEEVYARPGVTVWTALSKGVPFTPAVHSGLARAIGLVATDLQLARTHTARYVFGQRDNIVGYRRVPGGGNVCELCDTASTQRYHIDTLMPIHPNCSCDIEPIFGEEDPGQVLESSTDDERGDPAIEEHGEIGPVLVVAGDDFTAQDDI